MRILTSLKRRYPALVADLLLRIATPVVWEALTCGLEGAWALQEGKRGNVGDANADVGAEEDGEDALAAFYDELYSCVPDRREMTRVMLRAKETFAKEAMLTAVSKELGVSF